MNNFVPKLKDYLQEQAEKGEKIIGARLRKKKVKISDTSKKNIEIEVVDKSNGDLEMQFRFRDSLRFTDMGAGRGYSKGRPTTATQGEGRRPKNITNRPIHRIIHEIEEVVTGDLIDFAVREAVDAY